MTGLAIADDSSTAWPGSGGRGINIEEGAQLILRPGPFGGGGGAAGTDNSAGASNRAGAGGGTITLLCQGGITLGATGIINANGEDSPLTGGGGGGGGIIILATPGDITLLGELSVQGGDGGESSGAGATSGHRTAHGGGGGGIIHLVLSGDLDEDEADYQTGGGSAGLSQNVIAGFRSGGGGGGASYGNGGTGGTITSGGNTTSLGSGGSSGAVIYTNEDPAALFM